MGGNAWEEEGATKDQEEMNSEDNMPSGEILNESLPHFKFEYLVDDKCELYCIRHCNNVPNEYKKNHKNHEEKFSITIQTFMYGVRWGYIKDYKTSVKKIESEVIELNQTLEQLGSGSYNMQLPLDKLNCTIENNSIKTILKTISN